MRSGKNLETISKSNKQQRNTSLNAAQRRHNTRAVVAKEETKQESIDVNRPLKIVRDIKCYKEDSTTNIADQFDYFTKQEYVVPGQENQQQQQKVFVPPMFASYENKPPATMYRKLQPEGVPEYPSSYVKYIDPVYEEKQHTTEKTWSFSKKIYEITEAQIKKLQVNNIDISPSDFEWVIDIFEKASINFNKKGLVFLREKFRELVNVDISKRISDQCVEIIWNHWQTEREERKNRSVIRMFWCYQDKVHKDDHFFRAFRVIEQKEYIKGKRNNEKLKKKELHKKLVTYKECFYQRELCAKLNQVMETSLDVIKKGSQDLHQESLQFDKLIRKQSNSNQNQIILEKQIKMKVELNKTHHHKMDGLWPKFEEVIYESEKIQESQNGRKKVVSRNSTPEQNEKKKIIIDQNINEVPLIDKSTKDNEFSAQDIPNSPQVVPQQVQSLKKVKKVKKIKKGLLTSSFMIRMITKALHFQEQKLEMKISGDELISKTLSINDPRLIKKSLDNGYIVSNRNSKEVHLTKIIRRIQQGKISVDESKERLFQNIQKSLDTYEMDQLSKEDLKYEQELNNLNYEYEKLQNLQFQARQGRQGRVFYFNKIESNPIGQKRTSAMIDKLMQSQRSLIDEIQESSNKRDQKYSLKQNPCHLTGLTQAVAINSDISFSRAITDVDDRIVNDPVIDKQLRIEYDGQNLQNYQLASQRSELKSELEFYNLNCITKEDFKNNIKSDFQKFKLANRMASGQCR